jgi:hypothetical protein
MFVRINKLIEISFLNQILYFQELIDLVILVVKFQQAETLMQQNVWSLISSQ